MENLLLVLDELDDLFAMAGAISGSVFSFLLAVMAFVATGFIFLKIPLLATFIAATLLILGGIDELRARRQQTSPVRQLS